jgi:hypothetical protein
MVAAHWVEVVAVEASASGSSDVGLESSASASGSSDVGLESSASVSKTESEALALALAAGSSRVACRTG